MHSPSLNKPTQSQLVFPLLALAAEAGGTISSKDAYDALGRRAGLAAAVTNEQVRLDCGQKHNLWERHVRFARQRAKSAGYMTSGGRGLWQLTDEGQEALKHASAGVVVRIATNHLDVPVAAQVEVSVGLPTVHTLRCGDARDLSWIPDGEIPLIVTSVPYFDLKEYEHADGQMADAGSYDAFVGMLTDAMRECYRVMTPGGRMALNVGDVLRSRAKHGTHEVLPLSADLLVNCRRLGFQNLTGILWKKFQNCRYEEGGGGVLGQPDQPRRVIKSESERILLFKKPGEYFSAAPDQREASRIAKEDQAKYWREIWDDVPGAKATKAHPAPYPVEIPFRLIRMFSFAGTESHTVLDPFGGQFNTTIAAMRAGRNSASCEIGAEYFRTGVEAVRREAERLAAIHGTKA